MSTFLISPVYNDSFFNNIVQHKQDIFNQISSLFYLQTDAHNKSWDSEFETISYFIIQIPENQREEAFLQVASLFLKNRCSYSSVYNFLNSNAAFLKFLAVDKFKEYTKVIPQNIFDNNIYTLLYNCIVNENLGQAKEFSDIFLLPESKNVQHFDSVKLISFILQSNKKSSLNFLLENFDGWENKTIIAELLNKSSLDDALLDKMLQKIGKISAINVDVFNSFFDRNITPLRKVHILNHLFTFNETSVSINNFYFTNLQAGNFTFEQLDSINDKFSQLIQEPSYWTKFIESSFSCFNTFYESIIKFDFIDSEQLKSTVLKTFEKPSSELLFQLKDISPDSLIKAFLKMDLDLNHPSLLRFYTNLDTLQSWRSNVEKFFLTYDINFELPLNNSEYHSSYNNLLDYAKDKYPIYYNITMFKESKNNQQKQVFYNNLLLEFDKNENSSSNISYILTPSLLEALYKFDFSQKDPQEFFTTNFLNFTYTGAFSYSLKERLFFGYLDLFKNNNDTLIFNLPEENPLHNFVYRHQSFDKNEFDFKYTAMLVELNKFFHNSLIDTVDINNKSFLQFAKKYNMEQRFGNSEESKKSFFFPFFNSNKPLQIVRTPQQTKLIFKTADIVQPISPKNSNTNLIEKPNSFGDLIVQANQDLQKLNQLLDQYADYSLNVEVKIRAENILLQNINFLNTIKDASEDIAFEDMYFLKNNLNKYLVQSITTYAKSVNRYDVLTEPGNKLNQKSEEDLERQKEKIDNEALKQITLLEKELDLVKEHIVNQLNSDLLKDMRINTRVLEGRIEDSQSRGFPEEGKIVNIIRKP